MAKQAIGAGRADLSGERAAGRSVVGKVEIADEDPTLETADDAVRGLFARSPTGSARPMTSTPGR